MCKNFQTTKQFYKISFKNLCNDGIESVILPLENKDPELYLMDFLSDVCYCDDFIYLRNRALTEKQNNIFNDLYYQLCELSDASENIILFHANKIFNTFKR